MRLTFDIYEDRKKEIDFYFTVIESIDTDSQTILTNDNAMLLRIMKSNLVLMLYNITEACISNGIQEILERLSNDRLSYSEVISELQRIWSDHEMKKIYGPNSTLKTYQQTTSNVIDFILSQSAVELKFSKVLINMEGNLDSRKIHEICNTYRISHRGRATPALKKIKDGRNSLAHGSDSFSQYSRDLALSDLKEYKNDILTFLLKILDGMKTYYDNRLYAQSSNFSQTIQ